MKYNIQKLKDDIKNDTMNLRHLKATFRQSGYMMSVYDARALKEAKADATIRHSIAAHLHGRLHLHQAWNEKDKAWYPRTPEDQLKLIRDHLPTYEVEDPAERFQTAMRSVDLAGELDPNYLSSKA